MLPAEGVKIPTLFRAEREKKDGGSRRKINNKGKGSGQECPLHTFCFP
jgi:hypothetical protein